MEKFRENITQFEKDNTIEELKKEIDKPYPEGYLEGADSPFDTEGFSSDENRDEDN